MCPLGLLKADTMMCRSISDKSILVLMQFFPNYRITLTAHIAKYRMKISKTKCEWESKCEPQNSSYFCDLYLCVNMYQYTKLSLLS